MMDVFNEDRWRLTDKYVFFYSEFLSNFADCNFEWTYMNETHNFFCTEQAFMWAKAKCFKDEEIADLILKEEKSPIKCKHFGRSVKNYDDSVWSEARYQIMKDVNYAKYTQDSLMNFKLTSSDFDGKIFVEASPSDTIWGIGLGIGDDKILNTKNWKGQNLMGQVITDVRTLIMLLQK